MAIRRRLFSAPFTLRTACPVRPVFHGPRPLASKANPNPKQKHELQIIQTINHGGTAVIHQVILFFFLHSHFAVLFVSLRRFAVRSSSKVAALLEGKTKIPADRAFVARRECNAETAEIFNRKEMQITRKENATTEPQLLLRPGHTSALAQLKSEFARKRKKMETKSRRLTSGEKNRSEKNFLFLCNPNQCFVLFLFLPFVL